MHRAWVPSQPCKKNKLGTRQGASGLPGAVNLRMQLGGPVVSRPVIEHQEAGVGHAHGPAAPPVTPASCCLHRDRPESPPVLGPALPHHVHPAADGLHLLPPHGHPLPASSQPPGPPQRSRLAGLRPSQPAAWTGEWWAWLRGGHRRPWRLVAAAPPSPLALPMQVWHSPRPSGWAEWAVHRAPPGPQHRQPECAEPAVGQRPVVRLGQCGDSTDLGTGSRWVLMVRSPPSVVSGTS